MPMIMQLGRVRFSSRLVHTNRRRNVMIGTKKKQSRTRTQEASRKTPCGRVVRPSSEASPSSGIVPGYERDDRGASSLQRPIGQAQALTWFRSVFSARDARTSSSPFALRHAKMSASPVETLRRSSAAASSRLEVALWGWVGGLHVGNRRTEAPAACTLNSTEAEEGRSSGAFPFDARILRSESSAAVGSAARKLRLTSKRGQDRQSAPLSRSRSTTSSALWMTARDNGVIPLFCNKKEMVLAGGSCAGTRQGTSKADLHSVHVRSSDEQEPDYW
jgi:hypothetical protein